MANHVRLGLLIPLAFAACQGEGPTPEQQAAARQRVEAAAQKLGGELRARLQAAMQAGGPQAAVEVCANEAQEITVDAQQAGVAVGRSSLRLRNAKNAAPAWVKSWLDEQGERPVADLEPVLEFAGGSARLIRPIGVDAVCLLCHGPAEQLAPSIKTMLQEHYPADRATGYAVGDLRGVIWAEARL